MNERGGERRASVWNVVALIATLGLATVVAVVAVARSDRGAPEAAPAPTSPSPSPSATVPGGLGGKGPYVIYALPGGAVYAYDVGLDQQTTLGTIEGEPTGERSRQPGNGRVVAFPTAEGVVWRVTVQGLDLVGKIPGSAGDDFAGSAVSTDGRRMAVAALRPVAALVLVELDSGRASVLKRSGSGYPDDPLLPIAWSLGGDLVYQIPFCECDAGDTGLYAYDLSSNRSAVVSPTGSTPFYRFAMSSDGQELYYGTATERRCRANETDPCFGGPYALRRLAAGRPTTSVLERSDGRSFTAAAASPDGGFVAVDRGGTTELYTNEGDLLPRSTLAGLPEGAEVVALLPDDVIVARVGGPTASTLVVVHRGRSRTIISIPSTTDGAPMYLGWLR